MTNKKEDKILFRFRGLRKDGELIQSNEIDDFKNIQEFFWFEEVATMTKEMYELLSRKSNAVFSCTHHDFHPYECGGIEEECRHCLALKNNDTEHIKKCALCDEGIYWEKGESHQSK